MKVYSMQDIPAFTISHTVLVFPVEYSLNAVSISIYSYTVQVAAFEIYSFVNELLLFDHICGIILCFSSVVLSILFFVSAILF